MPGLSQRKKSKILKSIVATALVSILSNIMLPLRANALETDFEKGVKLYQQRQFQAAAILFSQVYKADPKNMTALFYVANCQLGTGQKTQAIAAYKAIIAYQPRTAVAIAAQSALDSIDSAAVTNKLARSALDTGRMSEAEIHSVASAQAAQNDSSKPQRSTTRTTRAPLTEDQKKLAIDEIVQVVRAQADRPNVSKEQVTDIKEALTVYPEPLLHLLWKRGMHIKITPTMVDNDPSLAYKQPRGYEDGNTYKNCPGLFNGYDIVLCEYEFIGDSPDLKKCFGPVGTLRHELGHAVDRYLGNITSQEEFRHLYLLDLGTIDDETKSKLSYYTQKDRAGPSETFAEIMCNKYGGRPATDSRKPEAVAAAFKLSTNYVNKLIASIPANK